MTTVPRPAARQPVPRCLQTISGPRHSTARSTDRRRARVGRPPADDPGTGRGTEEHGVVDEGTTVLRVEADDVVPSPGFAVVLSEAEAIGGGPEHEAGTYRQREHLDVVLNVEQRLPGGPADRRAPRPAHRPVQEDRPTGENRASYILGAWALGRTARPRRFGRWNLQRKGIGLPSLAMPVR